MKPLRRGARHRRGGGVRGVGRSWESTHTAHSRQPRVYYGSAASPPGGGGAAAAITRPLYFIFFIFFQARLLRHQCLTHACTTATCMPPQFKRASSQVEGTNKRVTRGCGCGRGRGRRPWASATTQYEHKVFCGPFSRKFPSAEVGVVLQVELG